MKMKEIGTKRARIPGALQEKKRPKADHIYFMFVGLISLPAAGSATGFFQVLHHCKIVAAW